MAQDWEVWVHHVYYEANKCIDEFAKRGNHQQQVLIIYDAYPTFVYPCYIRDKLGLGTNKRCTQQLTLTVVV